jgi:hypothetical protein
MFKEIEPFWLVNKKKFYPVKTINNHPFENLYLEISEKKLYKEERGKYQPLNWEQVVVDLNFDDGRVLKYKTSVLPLFTDKLICIGEKDWNEATIDYRQLETGFNIMVEELPEVSRS